MRHHSTSWMTITDDRSKMSIENYEACAQIKYTLKSKKTTSTEMKISTSMRRCCNKAHKTYREHLQQKKAEKEQKRQAKIKKAELELKTKKAKHLLKRKPQKKESSRAPVKSKTTSKLSISITQHVPPIPSTSTTHSVTQPAAAPSVTVENVPSTQSTSLKRKCSGTLTSWLISKRKK